MKFHVDWFVLLLIAGFSLNAQAAEWIETFALSPAGTGSPFKIPDNAPPELLAKLHAPGPAGTLRYRFAISAGGTSLRIQFVNSDDATPLQLAGASIALASAQMNAVPGSLRRLTFQRTAEHSDLTTCAGAQ